MAADGPTGWVNIVADDFTATVSTRALLAQADSHLAQLVELEMQRNPSSPAVRLDTSAAVAAEVVAALRQGAAYMLPVGDRRLMAAAKHQLDYLGVQLQPAAGDQHYLLVPAYDLAGGPSGELVLTDHPDKYGLLMYSSASRGWANRAGHDDPPEFLKFHKQQSTKGADCLASVIRAEYSGLGENTIYLIGSIAHDESVAMTAANMKMKHWRRPPGEFALICDAALTAAKSQLFILGGESVIGPPCAVTPLRIYEPRIDSWFEAQPPSNTERLTNSELVSNLHEGMLLSIGGYIATSADLINPDYDNRMSDRVAMLDINSGKWTNSPSGCKWPGAALTNARLPEFFTSSLSAAAYDEYSIMVVAGVKGKQARVDVLDLRTWRWREGIAQLQRPGKDARGVSVVAYEGKVVAVGGQKIGTLGDEEAEGEQQQQQQQQQEEDVEESSHTKTGVREVYSYDPAGNAWSSDAIARLPFGITRPRPVVARVSA